MTLFPYRADVIKSRTLKWRNLFWSILVSLFQSNGFMKAEKNFQLCLGTQHVSRGLNLLWLGLQGGDTNQGMQAASKSWKKQADGFPPSSFQKRTP